MLLLEVDEGVDGEDELGHGEGEDHAEEDAAGDITMLLVKHDNHRPTQAGWLAGTHGISQAMPLELSWGFSPLLRLDFPNMLGGGQEISPDRPDGEGRDGMPRCTCIRTLFRWRDC